MQVIKQDNSKVFILTIALEDKGIFRYQNDTITLELFRLYNLYVIYLN